MPEYRRQLRATIVAKGLSRIQFWRGHQRRNQDGPSEVNKHKVEHVTVASRLTELQQRSKRGAFCIIRGPVYLCDMRNREFVEQERHAGH
ncbi:hypothetical protein O3P69_015769 [Scylla paramamosain]|uniref:Uncharacterized protein n=1 Tax=Scylla paramamosain TaxID=85552 RepID=A0AAW0T9D0_SCYPA